MTTSTPSFGRKRRRGFSLVEAQVVTALFGLVMAAVLSAYLFIARSQLGILRYSEMETQARRGLEHFARDTRAAIDLDWVSPTEVHLLCPVSADGGTYTVVYRWNANARQLTRQVTASTLPLEVPVDDAPVPQVLGVTEFVFHRYRLASGGLAARNDLETKQIQLTLTAMREGGRTARASHIVISSRYVLRNKVVTQ